MRKQICIVMLFIVLFTITSCSNSSKPEPSTSAFLPPDAEGMEIQESETGTVESVSLPLDVEEMEIQEPEIGIIEKGGVQTEISSTELQQKTTEQEVTEVTLKVQIGDTVFTATPAENSSVDALKELLADGPLTLSMSDYANMEKGADLGVTLPQNNEQMNTQAGDIILYQGRTFVIYYGTNSWSLTPIGKMDNVDAETLRMALGIGDVTVTIFFE